MDGRLTDGSDLQREMSEPLPLVAFDDRLAEAARHEGLTVVPALKRRR
jgi:hypothetical protein